MMKRTQLLALACVLVALTGCIVVHVSKDQGATTEASASVQLGKKESIPDGCKVLEVENQNGFIRIAGSETDAPEWSWQVTARAQTPELAQTAASGARCKGKLDGDKFRLVVTFPEVKASFQSDLEIRAPKGVSVRTVNRYGRTEIADVSGDVDAGNQSGALQIQNIGGKVRAQNSYAMLELNHTGPASLKNQSGAINVRDVRGDLEAENSYAHLKAQDIAGAVRLRNQSGRIELENIGGAADVKTSYAELSAKNLSGDAFFANQSGAINGDGIKGNVKAATSYAALDLKRLGGRQIICDNQSGAIRLHADSPELATLNAKTSYAAIEVRLPGAMNPVVQAQTTYAKVESDFPINGDATAANTNAPRIKLNNQSGGIRVKRD